MLRAVLPHFRGHTIIVVEIQQGLFMTKGKNHQRYPAKESTPYSPQLSIISVLLTLAVDNDNHSHYYPRII